jgi:hypothetical protein
LLEQEKENPIRVLESRITRNYPKRLELVIGNDPGKAIPKDPVTNPKKPKSTKPSSIFFIREKENILATNLVE